MATATPGIAAQDSVDAQPKAFHGTVCAQSFQHILGTAGCVAALGGKKWGNHYLIEPYWQNQGQEQKTVLWHFHSGKFIIFFIGKLVSPICRNFV